MSGVKSILPPPFEWVEIPAGRVTLVFHDYVGEDDDENNYLEQYTVSDVSTFLIAKYPVTNAQYAKFVEAGGYRERQWWTETGWEARGDGWDWDITDMDWDITKEAWTKPRFWKDKKLNGAEQPVVGVSWHEAEAFCRWLSEVSSEPVTLPTEQQWQRAAQGDEGYVYPWGNDWDGAYCNNSVESYNRTKKTTPVTQYPEGASPFGVMDMSGNVWEWCLNDYTQPRSIDVDAQAERRALRGGSWINAGTDAFRATYRYWVTRYLRFFDIGFRCARSW